MTATVESLQNRDFTIIIDRSGSMATRESNGKSRWEICQETTFALASKVEKFDPDGLTLYTFASKFNKKDNVTSDKVKQVFLENDPNGSTALHLVLKDAFDSFLSRKKAGQLKENGEIIIVVTDGEPDDKEAVAKEIIRVTKGMDKDEELGILFAQVGNDGGARAFLKSLDDDLEKRGAKFDAVDTMTFEDIEGSNLVDVILGALND